MLALSGCTNINRKSGKFRNPKLNVLYYPWSRHLLSSQQGKYNSINLFSNFQPQNLCDIQTVSKISVSRDDEVHRKVDITLKDPDKEVI